LSGEADAPSTPAVPQAGGGLGTRTWLGLAITAALLAVAWYGTFSRIWDQWFPAWWRMDTPLLDRLTGGDSYYTHGPIVPVVSLAIAFYIYSRVGAPTDARPKARLLGWFVFLFFLMSHLLFTFASVTFASGFSLLGVIAGLVMIWGGRSLGRAYLLPIVLLFFMVPLPLAWIDGINFELKMVASRSALWLTTHLFSVPAVVDGSYVLLSPDENGQTKTLVIENVCGGLRSIIALTYFAALFAVMCRVSGYWRWFLLLMALPVAIACNIVRITGLIVVAHHWGTQAAGDGGWFHDLSGLGVFALALAAMFALESVILFAGHVLKRNWSDARLLGFLTSLKPDRDTRPRTTQPVALVALLIASVFSVYWTNQPDPEPMGGIAQQAIPRAIALAEADFTSSDLLLEDKVLAILETDDYVYRRFTPDASANTSEHSGFDLLIVFSKNNRRGTHSPELCIQGSGERIVSKGQADVPAPGREPWPMREVVSQNGQRTVYYLYTFKSGHSYTTHYTLQQAAILLNGLLRRDSAGALIRLTVVVRDGDLDAARRMAREAAAELMPIIDKSLP
jgi:EpsI family protein